MREKKQKNIYLETLGVCEYMVEKSLQNSHSKGGNGGGLMVATSKRYDSLSLDDHFVSMGRLWVVIPTQWITSTNQWLLTKY